MHKLSKKLLEKYNALIVEDLNMKGKSQALNFGKSACDNGWGIFLKIDRWFPSSKTCSKCGNIKENLRLLEKSYKCERCGIEINRDCKATLNIKEAGKTMLEY